MILLHFLAGAGALGSVVNTLLIWRILKNHDGTVANLQAALLHTVGERQAADVLAKPSSAKAAPAVAPLPQQRPRQIGLTPR